MNVQPVKVNMRSSPRRRSRLLASCVIFFTLIVFFVLTAPFTSSPFASETSEATFPLETPASTESRETSTSLQENTSEDYSFTGNNGPDHLPASVGGSISAARERARDDFLINPTPPSKTSNGLVDDREQSFKEGHHAVLLLIASRKRNVARRKLLRRILFDNRSNIRPCMKQTGPVFYKFVIYEEPKRGTSTQPKMTFDEERVFRADLMENDDIVVLQNTTWANGGRDGTPGNVWERQQAMVEWASKTAEMSFAITFQHAIFTDDNTYLRLDVLVEELRTGSIVVGSIPLNPGQSRSLFWGASRTITNNGVPTPPTVILSAKLVSSLAILGPELRMPLKDDFSKDSEEGDTNNSNKIDVSDSEDLWDAYYRVQLKTHERMANPDFEHLKVKMVADDRFVGWSNRLDLIPSGIVVLSGVFQDDEMLEIAERERSLPVHICSHPSGHRPSDGSHTDGKDISSRNLEIVVATSSYVYGDDCLLSAGVYSSRNKREYALRHGYAYVARSDEFEQQKFRPRKAVWGKLDLIEKILPHYDWLLWVDMDTVIVNEKRSVQDILETLKERLAVPLSEQNIGRKPGPVRSLIVSQPTHDGMINAGVFLIRNSPWSRRFLREVQGRRNQYWGKMYEQKAIWKVMQEPDWSSGVLHLVDDDYTFNTFPNRFRPGDFIVHYAPEKCPADQVIHTIRTGQIVRGDGKFTEGQTDRQP